MHGTPTQPHNGGYKGHHNYILVLQSFLGYNHICRGLHRSESDCLQKFPEKIFTVEGCAEQIYERHAYWTRIDCYG